MSVQHQKANKNIPDLDMEDTEEEKLEKWRFLLTD